MKNNKIKALFIGFNRSYTNPTTEIILRVLGHVCKLSYFGPGFSDNNSLSIGIDEWLKNQESFDIIITDSYVLECDNIKQRKKPFLGDFILFNPLEFYYYCDSLQSFFLKYEGDKIFIANFDTYGVQQNIIDRLITSNTYVIDGGVSVNKPKDLVELAYGKPTTGNDNWFNFVDSYKHKVISLPHSISSLEFDFSSLSMRKNDFNVIGAPYDERKIAFGLLPVGLRLKKQIKYYKHALAFRLNKTLTERQLMKMRQDYMRTISNSVLCYCSGGPWMAPVRKYFEIPARGAVSIGMKCNGFEDLGFIDGINFLEAKSNIEISKILLNASQIEFQSIAIKGREMIWQNHSDLARTYQLTESINKINEKTFKGSYWKLGKYLHY